MCVHTCVTCSQVLHAVNKQLKHLKLRQINPREAEFAATDEIGRMKTCGCNSYTRHLELDGVCYFKICLEFFLDMFRVADHLSCEEILNRDQQMCCPEINAPQLQ